MNANEFTDWLEYHTELHPALNKWVQAAIHRPALKGWRKVLTHADLPDCKAASENMLAGEPRRPFLEDDIAAVIAKEARRLKTERLKDKPIQYADGQQTYACRECRDQGVRCVWSSKSIKAARKGTLGQPFTLYSAVVACPCGAGEQWRTAGLPRFTEERFCELVHWRDSRRSIGSVGNADEQALLQAWVDEHFKAKQFDEFAAFAGEGQ